MLGVLKAGQAITIITSSARLSQKEEKSLVNCWHRQSGTTLDTKWITPRNKAIPQSFDCSNTRRGWLPSEIDLTTATTNYIYCWEDLLDTAIKKCVWRHNGEGGVSMDGAGSLSSRALGSKSTTANKIIPMQSLTAINICIYATHKIPSHGVTGWWRNSIS